MEQQTTHLRTYYRPEWTCGRYNCKKDVAIYYNLIEGISYFFEEDSAYIIGQILNTPKGTSFNPSSISNIDYSNEEISCFLDELVSLKLLSNHAYNKEEIALYRQNYSKSNACNSTDKRPNINNDDEESAEQLFVKACGEEYISSVMFELTYRCSEKCIHCYNPGATRNDNEKNKRGDRIELSLADYKRIIDELHQIGTYKVCLSGGDPFSNKYAWDIIDYLYQKDFVIDIYTNGQKIVNQIDKLANYHPHSIGISLYSNIPRVHDSITRIKGSYEKTMSVIEQCAKHGISVRLKCCIMINNVQSYHTVKDVAKKYNLIPEFELNITDSLDGDICASKYLRLPQKLMEIVFRDKDLAYYIGTEGLGKRILNPNDIICGAGVHSFCLTPEGYLEPCCSFPMFFGNVNNESISTILTNSKEYNWWKSQKVRNLKECHTHDYCIFCEMCVGNNYVANGNPLIASPNNCTLAKYRFELSEKLRKGEDPLQGKTVEERLSELKIETPNLHQIKMNDYRNKG